MIKAILFDVHGTLIDKDRKGGRALAQQNLVNFLNKYGYEVTIEKYQEVWSKNSKKYRQDMKELNEVGFYQWYEDILEGLGIEKRDHQWIEEINQEFMKGYSSFTEAFPGTSSVLAELKKNFSLGIVSNSLKPNTFRDLSLTGLIHFFDSIVISSEVGKRKPHPLIFQRSLQELEITPKEAIFVGDNPYEDIWGASQVGIKTVLMVRKVPSRFENTSERDKDLRFFLEANPFQIKPEIVIEDLKELLSLIKSA